MSESLGKIAKGASIAFLGLLSYNFSEFISRVIIARYTTQSDYGSYSIGFALLNFFVFFSCLGLQGGVTRCIAYFRGKGDHETIAGVIYSSLQLSIVAGIIFFILVFFSSDIFMNIFHLKQSPIIKIFAIAIPFLVIVEILSAIFNGFGKINIKVYFRDVLLSLSKISGIILATISGYGFIGIIYSYLLASIVTAALLVVYTAKKLSTCKLKENAIIRKKLFYFSTPLLITTLSTVIINRTDTLMLGYFKTSDVVGLYNTATPIVQLIPIFLSSMLFIYVPISSQLYSKNLIGEMRRNYAVLSKWILAATLPFFFMVFLFPEAVLNIIFGPSYAGASDVLRILSLGALINVLTGPCAATLLVIGKTKLNMVDNLIGAAVNIILNLILIPTMGIIGAAIATATSVGIINTLDLLRIFRQYKIHPFTPNYIKPVLASIPFVSFIYLFISPIHSIWMLILFFILFIVAYGISLIITRSLDNEDRIMFLEIEKIAGVNISSAKKILSRFM